MDMDKNKQSSNIKTCKNCGVPLDTDTKFCVNCGTPVQQEAPESKPAETGTQGSKAPPVVPEPEKTETIAAVQSAKEPAMNVPFPDEYAPSPQAAAPPPMHRTEQKPKQTGVFAGGILGLIVMAALLIAVIVAGVFQENFLKLGNIRNIYTQFMFYGTIACCAVLTSRSKGPDLSIGAVISLTSIIFAAFSGSLILGIIIAASSCILIGAANGALIVYLKMPSLLVTLVMSVFVRGISFILCEGRPFIVQIRQFSRGFVDFLFTRVGVFELAPLLVFAAALITVFLMVLLSRLGKPLHKRQEADQKKTSFFLAYVVSAMLAGLLGLLMLTFQGQVSMQTGMGYEVFILFVFAAITSSRFIDNRGVPVFYSMLATLFFAVMMNIFWLYNFGGSYLIQMVLAFVTIGMAIVSYISRKDLFKGLVQRL